VIEEQPAHGTSGREVNIETCATLRSSLAATCSATITLALPATFAGLGISATHYLGLAALRSTASVTYDPWLLALSLAIGITATWTSLYIAARLLGSKPGHWTNKLWGALIVATSVVAMCWASFHATHYLPLAPSAPPGVQIDARWVVLAVASVSCSILSVILLAINLDHRLQEAMAASASVLRATNSEFENRVAERTPQLSREAARTLAIIATAQDSIISFDAAGRGDRVQSGGGKAVRLAA
jgi:hypothetical protein